MAGSTVTLVLEGEIPLAKFAQAMAGFNRLVESLSKEVASGAAIQWTVDTLQSGSAIATARGESEAQTAVEEVVHAYLTAAKAEERGEPSPYSPSVHKAFASIAQVLDGDITAARFETEEGDATVYGGTAPKAPSPVLSAYGAVTGRVQTLTSRGSLRFTLFDVLLDRAVSCYLEPGYEETMRDMWGRIAFVEGWVTRDRASGRPLSVRRITRVTPRLEVEPGGFRQARGAVRVAEDAMNPETTIRKLRDA